MVFFVGSGLGSSSRDLALGLDDDPTLQLLGRRQFPDEKRTIRDRK